MRVDGRAATHTQTFVLRSHCSSRVCEMRMRRIATQRKCLKAAPGIPAKGRGVAGRATYAGSPLTGAQSARAPSGARGHRGNETRPAREARARAHYEAPEIGCKSGRERADVCARVWAGEHAGARAEGRGGTRGGVAPHFAAGGARTTHASGAGGRGIGRPTPPPVIRK